jgi:hypothetical protein
MATKVEPSDQYWGIGLLDPEDVTTKVAFSLRLDDAGREVTLRYEDDSKGERYERIISIGEFMGCVRRVTQAALPQEILNPEAWGQG